MKTVKVLAAAMLVGMITYSCLGNSGSSRSSRFGNSEVDVSKIEIGMSKDEVETAVGDCKNYSIMMGSGTMKYDNVLIKIEGDTVNAIKEK